MWEIKRVEQDRAFLTDEDLTEEEREKFARVACSDPYFVLSVFRTWDGVGYRFAVEENRMPELIEYLADVEKYMLDYRVEI